MRSHDFVFRHSPSSTLVLKFVENSIFSLTREAATKPDEER